MWSCSRATRSRSTRPATTEASSGSSVVPAARWRSSASTAVPTVRFVRGGTLDQPSGVTPDAHIFTRSKLPWITLPESAPAFDEYYDSKALWPAASLERLEAIKRQPAAKTPLGRAGQPGTLTNRRLRAPRGSGLRNARKTPERPGRRPRRGRHRGRAQGAPAAELTEEQVIPAERAIGFLTGRGARPQLSDVRVPGGPESAGVMP